MISIEVVLFARAPTLIIHQRSWIENVHTFGIFTDITIDSLITFIGWYNWFSDY